MPLPELIQRLDPPPPNDILHAAHGLCHRDFICVGLILNRRRLTSDHWIYIQSPDVKTGRIQNFKNWSPAMVRDPAKTSVGVEYFCSVGDEVWAMSDPELIELAATELVILQMARPRDIEDGVVFRQNAAYPLYDAGYQKNVGLIRRFLSTFDNFQTVGRNGMHRYNNMDHSMLTGILAVRNFLGERHDLWNINTEEAYSEVAPAAAN
jgi:protoporphyrinogen oxidase